MQQARLPQYRIEIKVFLATHIQRHECSHYRRTAKKKQIAATSRKGLEPRRRSGVGFGQGSDAGDSRRIGSGELDWMEFPKGRTALDIDCIRGSAGVFDWSFSPRICFSFSSFVFCFVFFAFDSDLDDTYRAFHVGNRDRDASLPYLTLPYQLTLLYLTIPYSIIS